jgi:hypothetical protein
LGTKFWSGHEKTPPERGFLQGAYRNRTGVNGFAGRCVTTPPRRRASSVAAGDRLDRWPTWSSSGRRESPIEATPDEANGDPVPLVHGFSQSSYMWNHLIPATSCGRTIRSAAQARSSPSSPSRDRLSLCPRWRRSARGRSHIVRPCRRSSPATRSCSCTAFPRARTCGATCSRRLPARGGARSPPTCLATATRRRTSPARGSTRSRRWSVFVRRWASTASPSCFTTGVGVRQPRRRKRDRRRGHRLLPRRQVARNGQHASHGGRGREARLSA